MYNRYIPTPDGSHARKPVSVPPVQKSRNPPCNHTSAPSEVPCSPESNQEPMPHPCHQPTHTGQSASGFLRQLLPREFDTGDLLVLLMLLLIAADCDEEKPNALLTLALYFFMQD